MQNISHKLNYSFLIILCILGKFAYSQGPELIGPPGAGSWGVSSIAVHPVDPSIIYISSCTGALFRTKDGGQTIEALDTGFKDMEFYQIMLPLKDLNLFFGTIIFKYYVKSDNYGEDFEVFYSETSSFYHQILFNPLNSNIIFMTRKDHEIWRSNNKGETWFKVTEIGPNIKKIAMAPSDTSVMYIAAEGNVLRSNNSGRDWQVTHTDLFYIYDIQVNPLNAESVYLRGYGKIYKSIDGGMTFNPILEGEVYSFTLDPIDTLTLYAVDAPYFELEERGLLKTVDCGNYWFSINNGIYNKAITDLTQIIVNPQNTEQLYTNIGHLGVFRSDNGGVSWSLTKLCYTPVNDLYIDSENPSRIITSQNGWGVMITEDGGENWKSAEFDTLNIQDILSTAVDFKPEDKNIGYLAAGYEGLYVTNNKGYNWLKKTNQFAIVGYVQYHPTIIDLLFVRGKENVEGNTKWYRSFNNGETFEYTSGSTGPLIFHPADSNTIYSTRTYSVVKSTDLGKSWISFDDGLIESEPGFISIVNCLTLNKDNPNILYCGQNDGLSKSIDGGKTWFQIDSSLKVHEPYHLRINHILLDDEQPGRFFVGVNHHGQPLTDEFTNGGLYLTENDGKTWRKIFDGKVDLIKFDNSNPRNIYFNTKFGLMRLVDTLTTDLSPEPKIIIPNIFQLEQNYPNPFNSFTSISYKLSDTIKVTLDIFNSLGQKISTLVNKLQYPGEYKLTWDANDDASKKVSSGIYYYRLRSGDYFQTKKMILLK